MLEVNDLADQSIRCKRFKSNWAPELNIRYTSR